MRAPPFVIESPSPTEKRVSFRVGDSWCRATELGLRCGARLSTTSLELAAGFAFQAVQPAAEVELVVSRGSALTMRSEDGRFLDRGGSGLQVSHVSHVTPIQVSVEGDTQLACVAVSLSRARLAELLGSATLPPLLLGAEPEPGALHALTPQLSRVLDEILHVDERSASRSLWLDAKCQELIALVTDQLAAVASEPRVTAGELSRLDRVRRRLEEHLERTPTLAELAKLSGFGETKLKVAFRSAFGESIFGYLRRARLEEARRLLSTRGLNVAEVAARVGYENPSKFAAAFRRQYQLSPSEAPRRAG